mmetsp:Transcript_10780/g.23435  ORF Transcript_10780/g.23435 Transcript_10780/m.23435 type:complete len:223 (+) Transcript_10780:398-1066(+)
MGASRAAWAAYTSTRGAGACGTCAAPPRAPPPARRTPLSAASPGAWLKCSATRSGVRGGSAPIGGGSRCSTLSGVWRPMRSASLLGTLHCIGYAPTRITSPELLRSWGRRDRWRPRFFGPWKWPKEPCWWWTPTPRSPPACGAALRTSSLRSSTRLSRWPPAWAAAAGCSPWTRRRWTCSRAQPTQPSGSASGKSASQPSGWTLRWARTWRPQRRPTSTTRP